MEKVGRGLLDWDSVSVLSTEFQYLALTKKSPVCSSNVLSCSWYSASLPKVFGAEIGMVKIRGLTRVASGVVDAVRDIKYYKFQVESPTSKPRNKTST